MKLIELVLLAIYYFSPSEKLGSIIKSLDKLRKEGLVDEAACLYPDMQSKYSTFKEYLDALEIQSDIRDMLMTAVVILLLILLWQFK